MDFPAAQEGFHLGPHFLNKVFLIVYQKSTKKETQPLAAQGVAFLCVFGGLPEVYQKSTKVTFCPGKQIAFQNFFYICNFFVYVRTVILAY